MLKREANTVADFFAHPDAMDKVLAAAIREALLEHKRAGNYVVAEQDGKVQRIEPEDIPVELNEA